MPYECCSEISHSKSSSLTCMFVGRANCSVFEHLPGRWKVFTGTVRSFFSNRHWWRYVETKSISLYKRKARMANVRILVVHQFYEKMFGSKMEVGSMWVVPRHLESLLHMFIGKPFILDEVLNSKILSKSLDGWLKEIRELDMIQSPRIPQISAYFLHHDYIGMTKTPQFSFLTLF